MGSVEFALVQKDVLYGLSQGNNVLRAIHQEMGGIEGVEKLMGETEDARMYQEVRLRLYHSGNPKHPSYFDIDRIIGSQPYAWWTDV